MTDVNATLDERAKTYGTFKNLAEVSQTLKALYRNELGKRGKVLAPDQYEALDMVMHKVARIINGDSDFHDSWIDIAGYATLVADRIKGVAR